jgi:hypothetical protein
VCEKYLVTWLGPAKGQTTRPLSNRKEFIHGFLTVAIDPALAAQQALDDEMEIVYHGGVGEAMYAMVAAWSEAAHAITRLLQNNMYQHRMHYLGL